MEILPANRTEGDVRKEISRIFVDGFKVWLEYFSKDPKILSEAFCHMFNPDYFYAALNQDKKIVGIAACTDGVCKSVRLNTTELRRHLGFIKGSMASFFMKRELENHGYPFPMEPGWGAVEFVATDKDFRESGVAFSIIRNIIETTPFSTYVLEVANTNTADRKSTRLNSSH